MNASAMETAMNEGMGEPEVMRAIGTCAAHVRRLRSITTIDLDRSSSSLISAAARYIIVLYGFVWIWT
jgi:hypothetical protein